VSRTEKSSASITVDGYDPRNARPGDHARFRGIPGAGIVSPCRPSGDVETHFDIGHLVAVEVADFDLGRGFGGEVEEPGGLAGEAVVREIKVGGLAGQGPEGAAIGEAGRGSSFWSAPPGEATAERLRTWIICR